MSKKVYRLTIIHEEEEHPTASRGFLAVNWDFLVRIGLAIAAFFHWW